MTTIIRPYCEEEEQKELRRERFSGGGRRLNQPIEKTETKIVGPTEDKQGGRRSERLGGGSNSGTGQGGGNQDDQGSQSGQSGQAGKSGS